MPEPAQTVILLLTFLFVVSVKWEMYTFQISSKTSFITLNTGYRPLATCQLTGDVGSHNT